MGYTIIIRTLLWYTACTNSIIRLKRLRDHAVEERKPNDKLKLCRIELTQQTRLHATKLNAVNLTAKDGYIGDSLEKKGSLSLDN